MQEKEKKDDEGERRDRDKGEVKEGKEEKTRRKTKQKGERREGGKVRKEG